VRANPLHIQQDSAWVFTNSTSAGSAKFHVSTAISNDGAAAAAASVRTTVKDASGATVGTATSTAPTSVAAGETAKPVVVTAAVATGVKLWTVQSPTLYYITVDLLDSAKNVIDSVNLTTAAADNDDCGGHLPRVTPTAALSTD